MRIVLANPLFRQCDIGAVCMLVAAWVRYAGTARSLSKRGSYALLIIGQVSLPSTFPIDRTLNQTTQLFAAMAQPIFQVLGPKYSEKWFDLKGRTTATMIISVGTYCLDCRPSKLLSYIDLVQPTRWEVHSANLFLLSQGTLEPP